VDKPGCSIASKKVTLSSTTTSETATITVTTTAATTSQLKHPVQRDKDGKWIGAEGGAILALLIFSRMPARRRSWRSMLSAIAVIAALGGLAGCSDFREAPGGSTTKGTTAGTYTFTVIGTGNPAVTAVTTTFIVTVN
jgi:hypothetical protein